MRLKLVCNIPRLISSIDTIVWYTSTLKWSGVTDSHVPYIGFFPPWFWSVGLVQRSFHVLLIQFAFSIIFSVIHLLRSLVEFVLSFSFFCFDPRLFYTFAALSLTNCKLLKLNFLLILFLFNQNPSIPSLLGAYSFCNFLKRPMI